MEKRQHRISAKKDGALVRINRYLALKKYTTRNKADELIRKGLVTINGKKAVLGDKVSETDQVNVHAKTNNNLVYYAYYKPIGVSTNPDKGVKSILETSKFPKKVFPVGRLDKESHGLIIMTNDGRVTDALLNPEKNHEKEYEVEVEKLISEQNLNTLSKGVHIERYKTKPAKVRRIGSKKFSIVLTEGKNRQIRRMCETLGNKVVALKRVSIMNILISKLKPGEFRKIQDEELSIFLKSLHLR